MGAVKPGQKRPGFLLCNGFMSFGHTARFIEMSENVYAGWLKQSTP